ncbi:MAG: kelch repeat-containing protein [Planctomycetota bacterium]
MTFEKFEPQDCFMADCFTLELKPWVELVDPPPWSTVPLPRLFDDAVLGGLSDGRLFAFDRSGNSMDVSNWATETVRDVMGGAYDVTGPVEGALRDTRTVGVAIPDSWGAAMVPTELMLIDGVINTRSESAIGFDAAGALTSFATPPPVSGAIATLTVTHRSMFLVGGISLDQTPSRFIWRFDLDTGTWMPVLFGVPLGVEDENGDRERVVHATYLTASRSLLIVRETAAGERRILFAGVDGTETVISCTYAPREGVEHERVIADDAGSAYLLEYAEGTVHVTQVAYNPQAVSLSSRGVVEGTFAHVPFNTPYGPRLPLFSSTHEEFFFSDVKDVEYSAISDRCQ